MAAFMLLALFAIPIGMRGQTRDTQTVSYGWETDDDSDSWTISDAIVATEGQGNTGTYAGRINTNSTTVQFNEKVYVTSFSYAFKRTSNNTNYSVYIETSTDGSTWSIKDTQAMNTFTNGSYRTVTKSFDGSQELYVRFRCNNTTAVRYVDDVTITYSTSASQLDPCDLALTNASTSLVFDLYNNANAYVINYTTSSTGAVTVSDSDYITAVVNQTNKTITVTPVAVTNGAKVITVNQAADDNYAAGSKTFTINITDSTPFTGGDVTFDAKVDKDSENTSQGEGSIEKHGVTFACDNGILGNGSEYRMYKNSVTTFSVAEGAITQIAFTGISNYAASGFATQTGWTTNGNNGTWTGSAQEVSFTASGAQVRATLIVVTVDLGGTSDPSIAADNVNLTYNATSGLIEGEIENYVEGTISASTEASWISDFTYDQADEFFEIGFTTTANPSVSERTATVVLTYTYDNQTATKNIIITQAGDPNAPGTVNNPYTVAQAHEAIDANTGTQGVYATGIVSAIPTAWSTQYNNITFNFVDEEGDEQFLQAYRCVSSDNANASEVAVGDVVVVYGNLKKHNNIYEFDQNCQLISLTHPEVTVEAPTFSPVAGTYADTQTVTISCETPDVDIFYTLDGTMPTDESTPYNGAITVSQTTTIKAIAYANDEASAVATATYHINSQDNPYTVTEALAFNEYPANGIYVHGIVSTAPTSLSNGTLTYYISVDGEDTNQLEVYKGKGLENANFTAVDDIQVGDIVTVYGNVVIYNNIIKEFAQGNYLVEFERPTTPAQEYTLTISDLVDVNTYVFAGDESEMLFEGEGSAQILEGTQVMISVDVEQGYVLQSLIVDGTNHAADIDGGMYLFNMPDHNVTVTATAVEDVPFEGATYTLASSIESGKTYIIVGQGNSKYYAMGVQNNNNRAAVEIDVEGTTATVSSDDVYEFTINSLDTDGFYSIYDAKTSGYLYAANKSANQLKTEAELDVNGEWEISFDSESGAASVVASNSENRNVMQYNNTSTLFSCYTTASQHPVFLYVKDETPAAETYTLTINGYGNNNKPSHYYLIASPVAVDLSNHALTTGDFDLYSFDQAQENEWQNWKDDTDGHFNLVPGTGYLYAHKTGGDFELAGTAYEGNGTVTLVKNDNAPRFPGWNLVGNPFGEVAYIEDGRDFYVLTDGNEILPYDGNDIQRLQGIFVVAENNNETMTFTTTAPANTGDKFVFNISQGRGDVIDRAMVRFGEGRTLPKFQLHETSTKLYIPQGDEDYAVVYAANNGELPLNFRAAENGSYTLSFDNQAGEFSSLHLIDNMSRADIDLLANPSYTFNAETTDDEGRFTLVYSKAPAGQTLPYSYGFEDNNLATDGWIANITSSSSGIKSEGPEHSGSYGFVFYYSEQNGSLISPLLTGGDRGVDVSFWYKEYSSSYGDEQFYVGYTTDESTTDVDRFTFGDIITASTSWQEYTYSFPAGTKRIAIKYVYNDAFYLYLDDFSFEAYSSCAKPTNLAVNYEGGTTATVTWDGEARSYNIDVNGTVTRGVRSPYTLKDLELATSYTVMVQADCGDEQSAWTNAQSFFTDCEAFDLPYTHSFETEDFNCWTTISNNTANEGNLGVMQYEEGNNVFMFSSYSQASDYNQYLISPEFNTTSAILVSFYYNRPSSYGNESFKVGYSTTTNDISAFTWEYDIVETDVTDWTLFEETMPAGTKYVAVNYYSNYQYYLVVDDFNFEVASGCFKPSALEATNIGTNSAVLNWTGDNDSYVLQYRTAAHDNINLWEQVGEDIIGTATLTQYTFDLSDYSGNGNIAIRHYNVSDMFRVVVDDIVVTDARGQEVVNEGFENSVPSDWQIVDYDGDGHNWARVSFSSADVQNGTYCMMSESYASGALTPDNWLIIPNVELGGTLTFYMRGTDASFPQENIGVFVTTASLDDIFAITPAGDWSADITTTANSYELTGLTASTEYEWQVKGICDDTESGWASSSFSTIDEGFKTFITAGAWNVADNWFPAGVPTIEDEVSIEAAATIPAGVVATAKRVDLNGGSILIKDGGQLKQGAATLRVTVEKEITAYGNNKGYYYFISSPFSGRTLYEESGTWSRVDNLFDGEYDFYAFDPTNTGTNEAGETVSLEWVNYKNNPTHISFQSDNGNAGLMYGEGYLYANQQGTTLQFVGTTGKSINYSETVDYSFNSESTDDYNGWKLVGNYFSCNAYINYVDANGQVLDADFYTLNSDNTYSLMSSNQPLPPCTGAMMNVSATGKVQYSTEPINSKSGMLNMTVSEGRSTVDQARVRFGEGHNLKHMSFNDHNAKLYIPQDNKDYAVVYAEAMGEMPVNFKAEKNGSYTISFNNDNVEFSYLHLIDNLTGNDVDLLENPNYNFDACYTDYAQRFKLVYTTGTTADNDEFGFISNNHLMILGVDGQATLKVMDVTGRTLSTETFSGNYDKALNLSSGVYMLQLIQGNNVKTQKIVVK
jgi:hypothetical protein